MILQLKPGSILADKKIHVVPKSVVDNLNLASTQTIPNKILITLEIAITITIENDNKQ